MPPRWRRNFVRGRIAAAAQVRRIREKFKSKGRHRGCGALLTYTKKFLKKNDYKWLRYILHAAYPKLSDKAVRRLCKGKYRKVFIHIDHYLSICPDEPFHFIVMFSLANSAFGWANNAGAKKLYVTKKQHKVLSKTAKTFLKRIEA